MMVEYEGTVKLCIRVAKKRNLARAWNGSRVQNLTRRDQIRLVKTKYET